MNNINKQEYIQWFIDQHVNTNHYYDEYLPYEFHLRMVVEVFKKFKHLFPRNAFVDPSGKMTSEAYTSWVLEMACYGHDSIEDARVTYATIKEKYGIHVAEIIRAVTNYGRGRNRNERMPDFVYEDIKNVIGATFVKLCDRIANVQYGKMMGSGMHKKYNKENDHFIDKIGVKNMDTIYNEMVIYLNELFL